jgi:APA family basic amino acid/polyamine antiporter
MRVRPGQGGRAIVEEAEDIRAAAIVMQLPYRNETPVYSKALQTVLRKRPCRVIVTADCGPARDDGRSAVAGAVAGRVPA